MRRFAAAAAALVMAAGCDAYGRPIIGGGQEAASAGPVINVVADCATLEVHAEGWPAGSFISVAIESEPGFVMHLGADGAAASAWPIWSGYGSYTWSVDGLKSGEHDATVAEAGTVECGPGITDAG